MNIKVCKDKQMQNFCLQKLIFRRKEFILRKSAVMTTLKNIEDFLRNKEIAVIGASNNKKKFGNIIFRSLKEKGFDVFPVNPVSSEIEGIKSYSDTASLPPQITAAVFLTKPEITVRMIEKICNENRITHVWFQQGSENPVATTNAIQHGLNVITGECILMFIHSQHFPHNIHKFFKKAFGRFPK